MPKLTAEMFSKFPEEMQKDMLENIPVQDLSKVQVIEVGTHNVEEAYADLEKKLKKLSRREALVMIHELMKVIVRSQSPRYPENVPHQVIEVVTANALFDEVLTWVNEAIKQAGEDNNGR